MSRRPPDRRAVDVVRRRPALLVPGGILATLQLAFVFGIGYAVTTAGGTATDLVTLAVGGLAYAAARALVGAGPLAAVYGTAADPFGDGDAATRGSLEDLLATGREGYGRVARGIADAGLAAPVLGVGGAAVAVGVAVVASTVVGVGSHLLFGRTLAADPVVNAGAWVLVAVLAGLGGAVASGLTEPLGVLDPETTADQSTALRFVLAEPRSTLGYAFVRGTLLAVPFGALILTAMVLDVTVGDAVGTPVVVGIAAMVAVAAGSLTHAVAAVYQVTFAAAEVRPFADRDRGSQSGTFLGAPARTALVALLLVGLVVGSTGVRVADVHPESTVGTTRAAPVDPGSDSPGEVVEGARARLIGTDHRVQEDHYQVNRTTGERTLVIAVDARRDASDRQVEFRARLRVSDGSDGWARHRTYYGEGTVAIDAENVDDTGESGYPGYVSTGTYRSDGWRVFVAPGYRLGEGTGDYGPLGHPEVDWRVVERTEDAVVLGIDDPDALRETGYFYESSGGQLLDEGSYVRLYVDRDTGRATKLVQHRAVRRPPDEDEIQRSVRVAEFSEYGSTDVERPDEIGDRTLGELFWDAAHY